MKLAEINETLDYFRHTTSCSSSDYGRKQKYEGMFQKLCKGKELNRDELIWLLHLNIWHPISFHGPQDLPDNFETLSDKHKLQITSEQLHFR